MTGWTETGRGVVNSWDCDENAHYNIQGYLEAFDIAARHGRLAAGAGEAASWPARRSRHIRYHSEMSAGEPFTVETRRAQRGDEQVIEHRMTALGRARLTATCIDLFDSPLSNWSADLPDVSEEALGRGLAPAPAVLRRPDITDGRALVTHRGVVTPAECDPDGRLYDRYCFARVSDAAPHIWGHAGFTHDWLLDNNAGRVAMEIKLTYGAGLRAGDLVHIESGLQAVSAKTFTLRHVLVRSETGEVAAVAEGVVLVMNLTKRKALAIPDAMRRDAEARLLP